MNASLRQTLYLLADEMRGMANIGTQFAGNVYELERAQRIMEMAIEIAALADGGDTDGHISDDGREEIRAIFEHEPLQRMSPIVGVDAAVFNPQGEILLIQRRDNAHWAMPGGLAEIGMSFAETAVKELWEEAGMRGQVVRLLGMFDARYWGSRVKAHLINMVFRVACDDLTPSPGIEALDAGYFARDALPLPLHPGHDTRIPMVFERLARDAYFDPADSRNGELSMVQRTNGDASSADSRSAVPKPLPPYVPPFLLHLLTRS